LQQAKPLREPPEDLPRRHPRDSRRSQLDGQRNALHTLAQLAHIRPILIVDRESRAALGGALRKKLRGLRSGQRRELQDHFAAQIHGAPGGDQVDDLPRFGEELPKQAGALRDLLNVVQNDERVPVAQVP